MRHTLFFAFLLMLVAGATPAQPAVVYRGGEITEAELTDYTVLLSSPLGDPLASYRRANDAGSRQEALDYLSRATAEIPWNRVLAAEARAAGHQMPAELADALAKETAGCIGNAWKAHMLERYRSEDLARLDEIAEIYGEALARPEQRTVRYIFRFVKPGAPKAESEKALADLRAVRERIARGELSFAEAATLESDAPSAKDGGSMGVLSPATRMNPLFRDFIFSAPVAEMSEVRLLHNGAYLVLVEDMKPGRSLTGDEWKSDEATVSQLLRTAGENHFTRDIAERRKLAPGADSWEKVAMAWAASEGFREAPCERRSALRADQYAAQSFFLKQNDAAFEPTEEQMRDYYARHPDEMQGSGIFRLTRFVVPVGSPDRTPIQNLRQATEAAELIRSRLADGLTTETLQAEFGPRYGLEIYSHRGWLHSTSSGPMDRELIAARPGFITGVHPIAEGAAFCQLHARRAAPLLSFEFQRAYIRRVMRHFAQVEAMHADQERLAKELGVRALWKTTPAPGS